jgi:hypothetical protein
VFVLSSRPVRAALFGLLAALIAMPLGGHWQFWRSVDKRAVTLPTSLDGLQAAPHGRDFGTDPSWVTMFSKSVHGAGFAGRMYWNGLPGPQRSGPSSEINLVVTRADMSGIGDEKSAAQPHDYLGDVTCTHTFAFHIPGGGKGLDGQPEAFPSLVLCWRNTATLSVSVMGLVGANNENARATDVDTIFAAVAATSGQPPS